MACSPDNVFPFSHSFLFFPVKFSSKYCNLLSISSTKTDCFSELYFIGVISASTFASVIIQQKVIKAVAAKAASTFVVAILLLFLIQGFIIAPRRGKEGDDADSGGGQTVAPLPSHGQFSRVEGNVKGVVVDENGLDVLFWRKHQVEDKKDNSHKQEFRVDDDLLEALFGFAATNRKFPKRDN